MINKLMLVNLALGICLTASASTEIVCAKARDNGQNVQLADESTINARIAELEKSGKTVEVTHLAVGGGAGVATNKNYWGTSSIDRVCAVLKY